MFRQPFFWPQLAMFAAAMPFAAMLATSTRAEDTSRVSEPIVHENLAVYFIHGQSVPGPVPLTLKEAMAAGKVVVHETSNVNKLAIENTGTEEVFVQAGDIVKGGQQDRVLTISMLVPANSGRLDIAAYCVEQGRWSQRGQEDVRRFASAEKALPSRDAKLAMMKPVKVRAAETVSAGNISAAPRVVEGSVRQSASGDRRLAAGVLDSGSRQSEVWSSVSKAQRKLSENLGAPVAAASSSSSLQLSLENERLEAARKSFVAALEQKAGDDDIVGYVFAIGGKLNSGDVYASNGLFKKMWSKQLEAAVTEAISEKDQAAAALPKVEEVRAFLTRAEGGKSEQAKMLGESLIRETRDSDHAVMAETRRSQGTMVHRAYVAY